MSANHHIVDADQLRELSGKRSRAAIRRWASEHGIRVMDGKSGPWTTIEAGVLAADSRFGLHGLKHRGVTDTPGTMADKKRASGHKTDAMTERYNHGDLQVVDAAGKRP